MLLSPQQDLLDVLTEWFEDVLGGSADGGVAVRVRSPHDWGTSLVVTQFGRLVSDRAIVIRFDGLTDGREQQRDFVAAVDEHLPRPLGGAVSAAGAIGLTSAAGMVGWSLFAAGSVANPGFVAGLLGQALQEPAGRAFQRMAAARGSSGPLYGAVARLSSAATKTPVVVLIDHADSVDDSFAEPLSRLLSSKDARALVVVVEHGKSLVGTELRRLAGLGSVGPAPPVFDEEITPIDPHTMSEHVTAALQLERR